MCPRKEPACISQTGSFRMLCRIGALKTRSYRPFSASIAVLSASFESPNVADKGSGWLTAWRFQPCPSSSRHAPPPPRSKNGSNVCGAGKPEASYPLVQAFATDNAATVSIGQPSPTNGGRATIG